MADAIDAAMAAWPGTDGAQPLTPALNLTLPGAPSTPAGLEDTKGVDVPGVGWTPTDPNNLVSTAVQSGLGGALEAGFQAKDFLLGKQGGPSSLRAALEEHTKSLTTMPGPQGTFNSLSSGIAQFGVAMLGIGKLTPLVTGIPKLGEAIAAWPKLLEMAKMGTAGAVAFDPHEGNLTNLLQQYPGIQSPVLKYMAANPSDSDALGRFKNAINSLLLPGALEGGLFAAKASAKVLTSAVEALKLRRMGDMPGAEAAASNAESAVKSALKGTQDAEGANGVQGGGGSPGGSSVGDGTVNPSEVPPTTGEPAGAADGSTSQAVPSVDGQPSVPGTVGQVDGAVQPGVSGGAPGEVSGTGLAGVPKGERVAQPAPAPKVEWTPEQFATTLAKAKGDVEAVLDAGSYDAAMAGGHAFADTRDLIPYQKLTDGTDTVDSWLGRMVESQADYINKAKRGTMSDATVDGMVTKIGNLYAIDPATIHGALMQAGKDAPSMVAKMDAAFTISQSAYMDAYGIMMRADAGSLGPYATYAEALTASKTRMGVSMELFASARAIMATGGRIVRRSRNEFNVARFAKLNTTLANMDGAAYADAVRATMGNAKALSDKVTPGALATIVDSATALQAANLIWGWGTLTGIAASSTANLYLRPLMDFAGSHYQAGVAAIDKGAALAAEDGPAALNQDARLAAASTMRTQARKEMLSTHTFMADGWYAALQAFQSGQSVLSPHKVVNKYGVKAGDTRMGSGSLDMPEGFQWQPINGPSDILYNALSAGVMLAGAGPGAILTAPFRVHNAVQEMISTMRYRAVVSAKADGEAVAKGLDVGSKPYLEHIEGRVRDSFGENGEALDLTAKGEADSTVFRGKLIGSGTADTYGGWPSGGAVVQQLANNFPPFRFVAPYVSVPANMLRQKVALTPGLNLLQRQYQNDITGANGQAAQASATGRMMMGLMLGMSAIELRMTGKLTGSGPADHKMASSWRADGNQACSIVSQNEDGSKSYFQLDRLAPYEGPICAWADIADMMMQGHVPEGGHPADAGPVPEIQDALNATVLATMHLLENNTALTNISTFLDAMHDENKIKGLVQRTLPGMVIPAASGLKALNQDPYLRELYGYTDGLKAGIPGLSSTLERRYDAYGDPIKLPGKFVSTKAETGPLGQALDENYAATGHYLTPPVPKQGGVDLRDVTTENGRGAYARFQELAGHPEGMPSMKETLEKLVQMPGYQSLTHGKPSEEGTRENAIEQVINGFHEGALGALRQESPKVNTAMVQRKTDIMHQNQTRQSDIRAASAAAGSKALNDLLAPYGMSLPVPSTNIPKAQP